MKTRCASFRQKKEVSIQNWKEKESKAKNPQHSTPLLLPVQGGTLLAHFDDHKIKFSTQSINQSGQKFGLSIWMASTNKERRKNTYAFNSSLASNNAGVSTSGDHDGVIVCAEGRGQGCEGESGLALLGQLKLLAPLTGCLLFVGGNQFVLLHGESRSLLGRHAGTVGRKTK